MIAAVDFDGTIVEHRYPDIGDPVPGAFKWLKEWQNVRVKLVLWTMRHDGPESGDVLTQAVEFCRQNGVEFWGLNENPQQKSWTGSPKAYAHLYVDDASIGCPLIESKRVGGRPMVNWEVVGPYVMELIQRGVGSSR